MPMRMPADCWPLAMISPKRARCAARVSTCSGLVLWLMRAKARMSSRVNRTIFSIVSPGAMTRSVARASKSDQLHRQGRGLAATDAQRRHALLQAALLQRAQQRDHDARTAGADGVAQGAGAAVHVHDLVRQLELGHGGH